MKAGIVKTLQITAIYINHTTNYFKKFIVKLNLLPKLIYDRYPIDIDLSELVTLLL